MKNKKVITTVAMLLISSTVLIPFIAVAQTTGEDDVESLEVSGETTATQTTAEDDIESSEARESTTQTATEDDAESSDVSGEAIADDKVEALTEAAQDTTETAENFNYTVAFNGNGS